MLKIAQIGVGYWGPNILRNLVANKRCRVTATVDLAAERREYVQSMYPAIRVTDNVDEVLQDPQTDAVVIATPVASHFDLAVTALEAKKHPG
jgi:predicted dehydrogenase